MAKSHNNTSDSSEINDSNRRKAGRPRTGRSQESVYINDQCRLDIERLRLLLAKHADKLVEKGEALEIGVGILRAGLEDESSRATFLEAIKRWESSNEPTEK